MPHNLRTDLSFYVYNDLISKLNFLKGKSKKFISWMCPLLELLVTTPREFIYYEGDQVTKMYFIKAGSCDFVLPKFLNTNYLRIPEGSYFGVIDIISSYL